MQSYFSKFEEQWFSYCNEELEKINTFFAGTFQFSATVESIPHSVRSQGFSFYGECHQAKKFSATLLSRPDIIYVVQINFTRKHSKKNKIMVLATLLPFM